MIVIRGIKEEEYARKIENNIVGCRDILSALLSPPVTGYDYSDYYEKNLAKALLCFTEGRRKLRDPEFLYALLIDYYIPHIYLTYFHVLNEKSLAWLDKFEDSYHFIALDIKLDRRTNMAIGREFVGGKMSYVKSIKQLNQNSFCALYTAVMCSIEHLFEDKLDMHEALNIYNTIFFPLLCREMDNRFTDIENEFRIIAYDCPLVHNGRRYQLQRETSIVGKANNTYCGVLEAGYDTVFNGGVFGKSGKRLSEVIRYEQGDIKIDSVFKSVNISEIISEGKYLGDKLECRKYMERMLKSERKENYVDRTISRTYVLDGSEDVIFLPGYQRIKY